MRVCSRFIGASLVCTLLLTASTALCAPTPQERETARRLMDTGGTQARAGDLAGALDAYKKAHEIMHVPTTGLAVAKAHKELGHLVEARDVAREVARIPEATNEPEVFKTARDEARQMDADLKPRIPALLIVAKGAAKVSVDGVDVPKALLESPSAVNPGKHTVVATGADGSEKKMDIDVRERETKTVELTVGESKAGPGTSTTQKIALSDLSGTGASRTPLATGLIYGGFGVGVVGVAVGAITGVMTLSKASDITAQCQDSICPPTVQSDLDSSKTTATVSTIGFAVGGAGIVAGVVGLLLPRAGASSSNPEGNLNGKVEPWRISPWISTSTRAFGPVVGAEGRF